MSSDKERIGCCLRAQHLMYTNLLNGNRVQTGVTLFPGHCINMDKTYQILQDS